MPDRRQLWVLIVIQMIAYTMTAQASSATSAVGSAQVEVDRRLTGTRFGFTAPVDKPAGWLARQHIDWPLNGDHAVVLISQATKDQSRSWEYRNTTLQYRWQLWDRSTHASDGGFRLVYTQNNQPRRADSVQARLLVDVPLKFGWALRNNMIFAWQVGPHRRSGARLEWRHQASRSHAVASTVLPHIQRLTYGIDSFLDMGRLRDLNGYPNLRHQVGPFVRFGLTQGWSAQLGYRAGITRAFEEHIGSLFLDKRF